MTSRVFIKRQKISISLINHLKLLVEDITILRQTVKELIWFENEFFTILFAVNTAKTFNNYSSVIPLFFLLLIPSRNEIGTSDPPVQP